MHKSFKLITLYAQSIDANDGREKWQPLKAYFMKIDKEFYPCQKSDWTPRDYKTAVMVLCTNDYDENGNVLNHFVNQQHRIPIKYQLSIQRLSQIAYNIGLDNNGTKSIHDYVSKEDLAKIDERLPEDFYDNIMNIICPTHN